MILKTMLQKSRRLQRTFTATLAITLAGLTLAGCVNTDSLSGNVYSAREAKQVKTVSYGTIINVRPVKIQAGNEDNPLGTIGGAVVGGLLGNTVGGGTGRRLATAAGAIAGGVAGQKIQGQLNSSQGVELEIRKDDGSNIIVVQKQSSNAFAPGQRVAIATQGNQITVSVR